MAGVDLEGQVVLGGELGCARKAPVAERETGGLLDVAAGQHRRQAARRLVIRALGPGKRAEVRVLRLDGDRTRRVALEHSADDSAELVEARHVEACDVPAGQLLPGDVVEEEVRS